MNLSLKIFFHSIGVKRWLKWADDVINIREKHEKSFKNHNGNNSSDFKNGQNPIKAIKSLLLEKRAKKLEQGVLVLG